MHHELPARLDLDWYRKQAKELVRLWRERDPEAVQLVEQFLGERARERFRLSDAQWVIAAEHGYGSWAEFRRWVETREPEPPVGRIGRQPVSAYEEMARERAFEKGLLPPAAQLSVAQDYGFPTWRELCRHVDKAITDHEDRPSGVLGDAFDLMRANDFDGFRALLDEHPEIVRATYKGASTSLLSALAQPEQHRVELRFAELLVERGADMGEALNLAACFNHVRLVRLLVDAGAPQPPSDLWGLTPMQAAIYHGSKEAADLLELVPDAFYVAAGAGRRDRLARGFDPEREPRPNLTDVGWPPFEAREGAQAILDEALALAAYSGRIEAMELLLEQGANVDGVLHGYPPTHFAAILRRRDVVEWLLEHGASLTFEAAWTTWGERGEVVLDSGLTYGGERPVRVRVTKRDRRYEFSDDGAALAAAGKPRGWRTAAERIEAEYVVNVLRAGAVMLPAVERSGLGWLAALPRRIAEASAAFYGELLELDDSYTQGG
jgi:hypothetical protein